MKATGAAFGSARRLALGERVAGLAGRALKRASRPPGALGVDRARGTCPVPARESFRAWWKRTDGGR